jgi:hypothetical protein
VEERDLAHAADAADDAPGHSYYAPGLGLEARHDVGGEVGPLEAGRVWIDAQLAQLLQLGEPLLVEAVALFRRLVSGLVWGGLVWGWLVQESLPASRST